MDGPKEISVCKTLPFWACLALNYAGFGLKPPLNLLSNHDDNIINIKDLLILYAIGENAPQTGGRHNNNVLGQHQQVFECQNGSNCRKLFCWGWQPSVFCQHLYRWKPQSLDSRLVKPAWSQVCFLYHVTQEQAIPYRIPCLAKLSHGKSQWQTT